MDQAEGSSFGSCLKTTIVAGGILGLFAVAGLALIGVVLGRALQGVGDLGETGCADSDVALIRAAATGDLTGVRRELDDGADVNRSDDQGNSALACAGPRGHDEVVVLLLERGASPDTVARDGDTVLGDAVRFCRPDIVRLLLDAGADPSSGRVVTLLDEAVQLGDAEVVEQLLAGKVDPASFHGAVAPPGFGMESTSSCPARTDQGQAAALAVLLEGGGDPTAVLGAAVELPTAAGGALVDRALAGGADPDGELAGPALSVAVAAHDPGLVAKLLAAGADPDRFPPPPDDPSPGSSTTTVPGAAPVPAPSLEELLAASGRCVPPIAPASCDVAGALARFADDSEGDESGSATDEPYDLRPSERATAPALLVAAWEGDAGLVRQLLAAGARVDVVTEEGFAPLHAAAAGGDDEVVLLLLQAGASTPVAGEPAAPSAIAAAAGHAELAKRLEAAGR